MQQQLKIIYLDWNVIVHLISNDYPCLLNALKIGAANHTFIIPFTAEHVEEASKIKSKVEVDTRLEFLSELTGNIYFENSVLDRGLVIRHPRDVKATLDKVLLPTGFFKWLANFISRPMLIFFRKAIGIDPCELNNSPPENVWDEIDRKILESKYGEKAPKWNGSPLRALIKLNEENSAHQFRATNIIMGASLDRAITRASEMKIAGLYSILESFGYYPESKKVYEKGSRFADASHCYYSQWADLCISRDKSFRMKSQAIAALTGSSVKYVAPENAIPYIEDLKT